MRTSISAKALLLLFLCPASGIAPAAETNPSSWLVGTWVLCEDPDGAAKDFLHFNANGSGAVLQGKVSIPFAYQISGTKLTLAANAKGRTIAIELSTVPGFQKLLLHSKRTDNFATYVRQDSADVAKCRI